MLKINMSEEEAKEIFFADGKLVKILPALATGNLIISILFLALQVIVTKGCVDDLLFI